MARPTKFTPERGISIVRVIAEVGGRVEAARAAGIGLRTLASWLARGEAGDPTFVEWAGAFRLAERHTRGLEHERRCRRDRAASRRSWQRFKGGREAWYLARLGPAEFWSRRLGWLADHGKDRAFTATVTRLEAEGFRINVTP